MVRTNIAINIIMEKPKNLILKSRNYFHEFDKIGGLKLQSSI
jgi:hypothetical protein